MGQCRWGMTHDANHHTQRSQAQARTPGPRPRITQDRVMEVRRIVLGCSVTAVLQLKCTTSVFYMVCVCVCRGFLREIKSKNHDKRSEMILSTALLVVGPI